MKPELEVKIRDYFESVVRMYNDDRFYVLNHMLAYLDGINAMDGFSLPDDFARARDNLEGWFFFGNEY